MTTYDVHHDHDHDHDHEWADAGSDFVDGPRFPGDDTGYTYDHWYAARDDLVDDDRPHTRRFAEEWAQVRRAGMSTKGALLAVFLRTFGLVVLGTIICAVIVFPPLAPFMAAGGVVVGVAVGLVMAIVNTVVTASAHHPPASKAAYRRYCRGLLSGLVVVTIGLGCAVLIANLVADLTTVTRRYDTYEHDLWQLVLGVAYSVYAVAGCLLVARWIGRSLADDHIRTVWPELDVPIPTYRQRRRTERQAAGGLPWG